MTIGANKNGIRHRGGVNRQIAQNKVFPFRAVLIELKAPHARATLSAQRVFFRITQGKGCTIINRRLAHVELFFPLQIQFRRRFKRLVKPAHIAQLLGRVMIFIKALRLTLYAIPRQAKPFEILFDPIDIFLFGTVRIGIIDTQNKLPTLLPRDQVVHQRRAQISNVNISCGGWGKSCDSHAFSP